MKKRIAYIITTAVLTGAAFFVGNYQPTKAANTKKDRLELIEITNASTGTALTYTDGELFYDFWIPAEALEENGLINVHTVKGWETWETAEEVGLEICGYAITKEPYTLETTVKQVD